MDRVLLWVDEDSDAFSDVQIVLTGLKCRVECRYSIDDAVRAIEAAGDQPLPVVLLDLICPLGNVSAATEEWVETSLVDGYRGWYGAAFLREFPQLASSTVVLSILNKERIERGLEHLALPQPAGIYSKLGLHKSIRHLRTCLLKTLRNSTPAIADPRRISP